MRYETLPKNLFIKNRRRFFEKLPKQCVAVFCGNAYLPSNGDGTLGFVQNASFYYLTGIDQEFSFLLLEKNQNECKETLYCKHSNAKTKIWEGEKLSKHQARELSGIRNIKNAIHFEKDLMLKVDKHKNVYVHVDKKLPKNFINIEKHILEKLKNTFTEKKISNSAKIIEELREIKQEEEIKAIEKAIEISKKGFLRALKSIKPGCIEFEIEAELSYEFVRNGSQRHAFQPIVAAGKNACILHYIQNDAVCQAGDLVLMDFGAEYANYYADVSRTVPVNGKFSERQKEVYEAVLRVFDFAKTKMFPGNNLVTLKKQVFEKMSEELKFLGLIQTNDPEEIKKLTKKYYPHGVSHFLGLEVHDVGDKNRNFTAGMLLTCEPGIYIEEEQLGIRIENDILITETGHRDLMEDFPIRVEEIEFLMQ